MQESLNTTVHTFTAATLREALAQVRGALGPDALILSQQRLGQQVAVRASLELPPPASADADVVADLTANLAANLTADGAAGGATYDRVTRPHPTNPPDNSSARDVAAAMTLQPALQPRTAPEALAPAATPGLAGQLTYAQADAQAGIHGLRGCVRFTGASGVGKTSTLIKVLVEWVMRNGASGVAVVSADNQRLAGTESLQLACQMLGVPMYEHGESELARRLPALAHHDLVLVDTAALELTGGPARTAPSPSVRNVFVGSACHSVASLDAQRAASGARPGDWVAMTHIDQMVEPAAIGAWLARSGLRAAWFGTGAYLPEGIDVATPEAVRALFGEEVAEPPGIQVDI